MASAMANRLISSSAGSLLLLPVVAISLVILSLSWLVHRYFRLSHIPGPFWSAFSDVPRLCWAWSERIHETHIALHRQYGDVVRLGPNCVSVGSPLAIPAIYGTGSNLPKARLHFRNPTPQRFANNKMACSPTFTVYCNPSRMAASFRASSTRRTRRCTAPSSDPLRASTP